MPGDRWPRGAPSLDAVGRNAVLLAYAAVCLFPILWILSMSLKPRRLVNTVPPAVVFAPTLDNYVRLLARPAFVAALWNSVVVVSVAVAVTLLVGVPAAYALSRYPFARKRDILIWVLSSRMLPPVAVVVPFFILYRNLQLYDTRVGLVVMYVTINISIVVWVMKAFFDGIPETLEEAAMVDGATRTQAIRRVVVPAAVPGIVAVAVISFIFGWIEFLFALMLTTQQAVTAPIEIYQFIGAREIDWGMLAAASSLVFVPLLVLIVAVNRYLAAGLSFGVVLKE